MAAGEEAAAAAREDFARHWQEEFPGEPAPRMELGSVRAMERELERCRRHLRRLQRALAEERFKVLYLEAALARAPPRPPALPRRRPPPAAPRGSSPEGGSDGSSGAEDASSADFNYGAEDYDAEGNEEPKALPEGSETMPYIDESPTMSPQLSARGQESGDGVSPTPTDGLSTGVGGLGTELGTRTCENWGWDASPFLEMILVMI
ncbi:hypothetical protein ASZ78_004486 [Callipepla squamata]|uniref:Bcr-Abl oncoprotein oligomerisation domain-containing protein n=1 Tax=Callipepla squamata TaxID=9009 RepID=A0A226MW23_CALSU|nr:hypothetical protein ASZ78_004486 [Callipepla squamata]